MSPVTTHVLDLAQGRPAPGVPVVLKLWDRTSGQWKALGGGVTDPDGRARDLLPEEWTLEPGLYRLEFDTGLYFEERGRETFYPRVEIIFEARDPAQHYHVPLLLGPFGYTTYRGS